MRTSTKTSLVIALSALGFAVAAPAQMLLYEWQFNGAGDTATNSAATYAVTPGTGNLTLANVSGDAITPGDLFFTNDNFAPANAFGLSGWGYLDIAGQGYKTAPTAIAIATNLNLGNLYQFTVTFWMQMGPGVSGQLPRLVQFGAETNYDVDGKGAGNVEGVGTSIDNDFSGGGIDAVQNGCGSYPSGANPIITITNNPNFPNGLAADGSTWYFEAITYDGTQTTSNFTTWIGTTNISVQPFVQTANFSAINFTTNATVMIAGDFVPATPRGLASGGIGDVRFYKGVMSSNNLDEIRRFGTISPCGPPFILGQPHSGSTYVGESRSFTVVAITGGDGDPPCTLVPLTYQWYSNNVPVAGAVTSTLTLTNVPLSANGASFYCTVANGIGGTNSQTATITVSTPPPGSYAAAVMAENPYAFWRVNETNSSAPDVSPVISDYVAGLDGFVEFVFYQLDFAYVNGPQSPAYPGFAANNTAIQAGYYGYMEMGPPGGAFVNSGMTIAGWVYTYGFGDYGLVYSDDPDAPDTFGLVLGNNNEVDYQWGPTPPGVLSVSGTGSGLDLQTNEWSFVAIVVQTNTAPDTNVTIYIASPSLGFHSASDSTRASGDLIASGVDPIDTLTLGDIPAGEPADAPTGLDEPGTAAFNDVAIFYRALSPHEIATLYFAGGPSFLPPLTLAPDPNTPGNLLLTYKSSVLQSANAVTGPWMDMPGAVSPYSFTPAGAQYYRVRFSY